MPSKGPLTYRVGVEVSTLSGSRTIWSDGDTSVSGSPPSQPLFADSSTSAKCIVQFLNRQQKEALEIEFRILLARAILAFPTGTIWAGQSFVTCRRVLPWTNSQPEEASLLRVNQVNRGTEVISIDALRYKVNGYATWSSWCGGQATVSVSL